MAPTVEQLPNGGSIAAKSTYVADPALQPFLDPSFDSATYLNSVLPYLSIPTTSQTSRSVPNSASLSDLNSQFQTLLSQLSANTARLTNTLTTLTDEILRSGSRLTYEVEVLRGETMGLSETLAEGLVDEVGVFLPEGLSVKSTEEDAATPPHSPISRSMRRSSLKSSKSSAAPSTPNESKMTSDPESQLPPYLTQLRTLSLVKDRLDSVIKVFGDAMEWTLPPSEISLTSSFISVSAPEPGSESHSREEKGREVAKTLKTEVADLLAQSSSGEVGVAAANERIEELRTLARVWKGTAEEKARIKFVESLARLVEEKQRAVEKELGERRQRDGRDQAQNPSARKKLDGEAKGGDSSLGAEQYRAGWPGRQGGYGFIDQLQRMRGGL
ncbi:MAG: hypothetical protein M1833_002706 [Piccolia ochrophora]|nr:MAG: hypothetical protein M1833_002706 [Piccolia ochrophora]